VASYTTTRDTTSNSSGGEKQKPRQRGRARLEETLDDTIHCAVPEYGHSLSIDAKSSSRCAGLTERQRQAMTRKAGRIGKRILDNMEDALGYRPYLR
jgi:hypothetical protein